MQKKGMFITFEGGEGTGKSTQVRLLKELFEELGIDLVTTGEPQHGKIVRKLLVEGKGSFPPEKEAEMMFEDREDHLKTVVFPALAEGKWVVSDRFADTTRSHQGYGFGVDLNYIDELYKKHVGDFEPNLSIIFDLDHELGLERSFKENKKAGTTNESKYENLGSEFHKRVRQGCIDTANKYPKRCVLLDASGTIEDIHERIVKIIEDRFGVDLKKRVNKPLKGASIG